MSWLGLKTFAGLGLVKDVVAGGAATLASQGAQVKEAVSNRASELALKAGDLKGVVSSGAAELVSTIREHMDDHVENHERRTQLMARAKQEVEPSSLDVLLRELSDEQLSELATIRSRFAGQEERERRIESLRTWLRAVAVSHLADLSEEDLDQRVRDLWVEQLLVAVQRVVSEQTGSLAARAALLANELADARWRQGNAEAQTDVIVTASAMWTGLAFCSLESGRQDKLRGDLQKEAMRQGVQERDRAFNDIEALILGHVTTPREVRATLLKLVRKQLAPSLILILGTLGASAAKMVAPKALLAGVAAPATVVGTTTGVVTPLAVLGTTAGALAPSAVLGTTAVTAMAAAGTAVAGTAVTGTAVFLGVKELYGQQVLSIFGEVMLTLSLMTYHNRLESYFKSLEATGGT